MESELIKPWNSNLKAQPPLGITGLLRESFNTSNRNRKLLLSVLLVVFLLSSQLDFAKIYFLKPVAEDLSLQLAENPKLFQDVGNSTHQSDYNGAFNAICEVLLAGLLISTLSSILSIVSLVATVSSSSEAYTSKAIDQKEMILKVQKSWKKPMLTFFYMILIAIGLYFGFCFFIGIIYILAKDTWALYLLYGALFLMIAVVGFYVSALWTMSLVVSVLEDVGGLKANVRAIELMKGKKVQASLIMVLFAVAYGLIHLMTNALTSQSLGKWSQSAISIPFTNGLLGALKLFMFVVFTVFYHERKESCDEKEVKWLYVPVVVDEV